MTVAVPPIDRPADIAPLLAYLDDSVGLRFEGERARHVVDTLRRLVKRSSANDAATYLGYARQDPGTRDELISAVTVGETYFFRHPNQLAVIAGQILPERRAARGPHLQIWSAGCATGEEAYTLAMILEDVGMPEARVIGTDLSARSLATAGRASYRPWSVRSMDAKERLEPDAGSYRVPERFLRRVEFNQLNLVSDAYPGGCDLIVCRNVLLYLTPAHVADVGRRMAEALTPGGWIVTAATDPDVRADDLLRRVPTDVGLMYRRRDPHEAPTERRRNVAPRATTPQPTSATQTRRPPDERRRARRPGQTGIPTPPTSAQHAADAQGPIANIRALGDSGQLEQADRAAADAIQRSALDAELRCAHAEILLAMDRADAAAAQASAAVYLDPRSVMAHLLLGRAELARGRRGAAARSLRTSADLLQHIEPDAEVPFGGGTSAGQLRRYAQSYLQMASQPERGR